MTWVAVGGGGAVEVVISTREVDTIAPAPAPATAEARRDTTRAPAPSFGGAQCLPALGAEHAIEHGALSLSHSAWGQCVRTAAASSAAPSCATPSTRRVTSARCRRDNGRERCELVEAFGGQSRARCRRAATWSIFSARRDRATGRGLRRARSALPCAVSRTRSPPPWPQLVCNRAAARYDPETTIAEPKEAPPRAEQARALLMLPRPRQAVVHHLPESEHGACRGRDSTA